MVDILKYIDSVTMRNYLEVTGFIDTLSPLEKCIIIAHSRKTPIEEKEIMYNILLGEDGYNKIKLENPGLDNEWVYGYFENYYLYIPSPFHPGDFIKNVATGEIGVLTYEPDTKEEEEELIKRIREKYPDGGFDGSDIQYRINYFFEYDSGFKFIHCTKKPFRFLPKIIKNKIPRLGHDHWDILQCDRAYKSDMDDSEISKLNIELSDFIIRNSSNFNPDDIVSILYSISVF